MKSTIPVLVIEDDVLIKALIGDIGESLPELQITVVDTRAKAMQVLDGRSDFAYAFVDWNLPDGTTKGVIGKIDETQPGIVSIFATSGDQEQRTIQMACERATAEVSSKIGIIDELKGIPGTFEKYRKLVLSTKTAQDTTLSI